MTILPWLFTGMLNTDVETNNVNGISSQTGDVAFGSGGGKVSKVVIKRKPWQKKIRIGTWNVRTMQRKGKLENIKQEMLRNRLNILGLSEGRWKDNGDYPSGDIRVIHTAGKQGIGGVAILLDKEVAKRVTKVDKHSDRLIMVKVQAEPVDMVIIQVYMPTTGHDENEIEEMYECIEKFMDAEKGNDNLVIMGDWNAVIGEGKDGKESMVLEIEMREEKDLWNFVNKERW